MKILNKFIWSKKEPSNKNDIWFDGSTWRMYTEEAWQSFTLPVDAADKVAKVIENASEVYQEKLNAGYGIIIEGNTISLDDSIKYDDSDVWEAIETLQQNKVEQTQLNDYVPLDRWASTSQVMMDNISELNSIKLNKTDVATINGQSLTKGGNIVIEDNSKIIFDFEKLGEPIESSEDGMEMRYSKEQFENAVGMSMSEFIEKIKTSELVLSNGAGGMNPYYVVVDEYTWVGYYKMVGLFTYALVVDTTPSEEKIFVSIYDESVDLPFATTEYVDEKHAQTDTKLAELSAKTEHIESAEIKEDSDEIIIENNNGDEVGSIGAMTEEAFASEQRWESNDGSEVYVKIDENGIDGKVSRIIPAISIPSVVEPSDDLVDEGYSSPIGRNNVKRADWSAENKYTYYDFLAHYYDGYLGETDGYSVTKRSLGSDASNSGYELFEYDFCPINYKKVVMISAGMNTCETGALWGLVTFIKAMLTSDEEGFKFLRENVRFKVLPMICPSSFDKDTLAYPNANGVRINKNFDYRRMWYDVPETNKGEYPDSEVESRILKAWLNENAWKADLYIDCHQDPDKNTSQVNDLTIVICSDSATNTKLKVCFPSLVQFYRNKGYIGSGVTPNTYSWVESGINYPKTKYAKETCGIPAIMIEQYCSSTMYGSDGNTINDAAGIKNYATMLRLYTFAILADKEKVINCGSISRLK